MAALSSAGAVLGLVKMPETRGDLLDQLRGWVGGGAAHATDSLAALPVLALIEQQTPRPTLVFDHELKKLRPRILKSTCLLYASYERCLTALQALGISHEEVSPARWQKALRIPPRSKGENTKDWKRRLKGKAQQLFPREKVTLAVGDALLIAEYARRQGRT